MPSRQQAVSEAEWLCSVGDTLDLYGWAWIHHRPAPHHAAEHQEDGRGQQHLAEPPAVGHGGGPGHAAPAAGGEQVPSQGGRARVAVDR